MINFRNGIYETNSSSTHCLVITTKENWNEFKKGNMIINLCTGDLITITNEMNIPRKLDSGQWEFEGKLYNEIFDIVTESYEWWDFSKMLYEAYSELATDTIIKKIDKNKIAISINASSD